MAGSLRRDLRAEGGGILERSNCRFVSEWAEDEIGAVGVEVVEEGNRMEGWWWPVMVAVAWLWERCWRWWTGAVLGGAAVCEILTGVNWTVSLESSGEEGGERVVIIKLNWGEVAEGFKEGDAGMVS